MVTNDGLLRIFWPTQAVRSEGPGVLVGWRNSELDILVASVLEDVEARRVDNALHVGTLFRDSPYPVKNLLRRCGSSSLQILGVINPSEGSAPSNSLVIAHTTPKSKFPHILMPSYRDLNVQIILFEQPNPIQMQYMSLEPIALSIGHRRHSIGLSDPTFKQIDENERARDQKKQELVTKLQQHTVLRFPTTEKEAALQIIINQINCSSDINSLLQKNVGRVRARARRATSMSERVVESATNLWDNANRNVHEFYFQKVLPPSTKVFLHLLMLIRILAELLLTAVEYRPRARDVALKEFSATAQQIDLRLQQFCYWPIQYITLRDRKENWESISNNHAEYIRFYNSLWLVANDVILGSALGSFIINNADLVALEVDRLIASWSLDELRRVISWLMVNPAGLKLNTDMAKFLGELFLWVIDYWAGCVAYFEPYLPGLIRAIGFASFAGATMPFSLVSDLISLLTIHIHCFYVAAARIYGWQLTIITSLFHLFRGRKRNMLRNRIDSCDYDLDQLLLGTILFTLLTFLLPTVMVFYFTFALARMGIILAKGALDILLACLNHFPLFAIMLRFKDSWRLPGGIRFELRDTPKEFKKDEEVHNKTSYIALKSIPLPLESMFREYYRLGSRIQQHYLSPSVFFCLVTGTFVPPLHRKNLYSLQYSMLPATRVGVQELWQRLVRPTVAEPAFENGSPRKHTPNGLPRRGHG